MIFYYVYYYFFFPKESLTSTLKPKLNGKQAFKAQSLSFICHTNQHQQELILCFVSVTNSLCLGEKAYFRSQWKWPFQIKEESSKRNALMVKTELFYPFTKFNFVFSLCFCTLFYWPIQTTVTLCTSQGARINSKNNGFIMLHLLGNMLLSMRHFRQISDLMLNTISRSFSLTGETDK